MAHVGTCSYIWCASLHSSNLISAKFTFNPLNQVILGSVAVKNACPELVPAALKELDNTINLFEKAQIHPVAKNGLVCYSNY